MRLNKTDGFTLGFVIIAAFAVLLNGFLKHQPDDSVKLAETKTIEESFSLPLVIETVHTLKDNDASKVLDKQTEPSFAEAFAIARSSWGPGAIFEWNGQSYTTSFAEEIVKPGETLDSTRINLVLNQSAEK
ncbi:MAG: hypothetical protein QF794_09400 [Candidatus Marinimicrobia bacterium]|jgi:hypothetical protein|nr:hypothetical protein [Candidatus Neomarinimicrobiota bacterium]